MIWLKDNIANILVLSGVLVLVSVSLRSLFTAKRSGACSCGCSGNCSNCALASLHKYNK
ncbi:MAG: FeoB-associated Cys-rich membrane protein [Erysipelotrichaceae bacterium]|nr:FeoB-associated Cys-rich membrane protein [Erysipelotrichaceae bacterium]